jgi:WD40 repeat protein
LITVPNDGRVKFWDLATGQDVFTLESGIGEVGRLVDISFTGDRVAAACHDTVVLWNTTSTNGEPEHN